jgi:ABC-type sugar transport system substrate-binding protein
MRSLRAAMLALVVVSTVLVSGCGSSDDSGTSSSTVSEAGSRGYAEAQKIVEGMTGKSSVSPTAPLTSRPEGKTVAVLDCGLPPCKEQSEQWQAEGPRLGMSVKIVPSGITASAVNSALDQVLAMKPDGVAITGLPTTFIQSHIPRLKDAGIDIVTVFTNDDPQIGPWNVAGNAYQEDLGVKQAAMAAVLGGGKGHELLVNADSIGGQTAQAKVIEKRLPEFGDFKITRLSVNPADIGKNVPNQVVSAVQRDPSINLIQFTGGDFVQGVAQALQRAGLRNQVKIIATGGPTSYGPLKAGQLDAAFGTSQTMVGWASVDAMARKLTGQRPENLNAIGSEALYPKDVTWDPNTTDWPGPDGWQANYEKLWRP